MAKDAKNKIRSRLFHLDPDRRASKPPAVFFQISVAGDRASRHQLHQQKVAGLPSKLAFFHCLG